MERAAREDRLRLLGSQVFNLSLLGTFSPRLGLKVAQRQLLVHIHMPRTACTSPGYPRLDWEMLPQCHTSKLGGNRAACMNRRPELICRTSAAMLLVKPDPSHILQSGIIPPPTCADTSTLARKHKHSHKQSKRKNHSQRRKLAF